MGLVIIVSAEITCDGKDALEDECAHGHKDAPIESVANSTKQARNEAIRNAQKAGWRCRNNRWLCPSCAKD